jgi:hypothetical protein
MAIEIIQTPRGERSRDTETGRFVKSDLGAIRLPKAENIGNNNDLIAAVFSVRDQVKESISNLNSQLAYRFEGAFGKPAGSNFTSNDILVDIRDYLMRALNLEKKEDREERQAAGRASIKKSDVDADGKPEKETGGGIFGNIMGSLKGAFGSAKDSIGGFLSGNTFKLLLVATGLFALTKYSEKIIDVLEPYIKYIDEAFEDYEKDPEGTKKRLKNDFRDKIVNPSLGVLGLELNEQTGEIQRIKGSWLDVLDPFTGPTNIFNTISSLFQGKNPDTGEYFLPEWMVKPIVEFEWYKNTQEFLSAENAAARRKAVADTLVGLWNGEWNGESFLPDWMVIPINEMQWYNDTKDFMSTLYNDPKGTLKALWEGKDPKTGESFLPEWMTMPINEMQWYKDTLAFYNDFAADTDFIPTTKEMKDAMKDFGDKVSSFIYNEETGAVFGMDLSGLKDLLPTIQEIADSIVSALPKWMRPKTEFEKLQANRVDELQDSGFFDKDLAGFSEIKRDKIKYATSDQLKSLLALESDDLREDDIRFIKNTLRDRGDMDPIKGTSNQQNIETSNQLQTIVTGDIKDRVGQAMINSPGHPSNVVYAPTTVASNSNNIQKGGDSIYAGGLSSGDNFMTAVLMANKKAKMAT